MKVEKVNMAEVADTQRSMCPVEQKESHCISELNQRVAKSVTGSFQTNFQGTRSGA